MKRGALPLNALRAFEATARLGRMSDAAEELGVTYGAISRQVRGLEARLGVALFEGPRNRLSPTDAALRALPDLTAAFDGLQTVVDRLAEDGPRKLDVSCLGTFAMRWLIPRLVAFQAEQPTLSVRLTTDDGPVDFRRSDLDVALRVGPPEAWTARAGAGGAIAATPLFAERWGPVMSPRIAPAHGDVAPPDFDGLPRLHTRTRPTAWRDWFAQQGLTPRSGGPEQSFEHFYFLLEAAVGGLGVAIAPEVLVRDDVAAGRLVAPCGFTPSGLVYTALARTASGPAAQRFIDWLATTAEAERRGARVVTRGRGQTPEAIR